MGAAVNEFLGLDLTFGPGISEATGHHPGGEHHADTGAAPGSGPAGSSASTLTPATPVAAREG
jgi:hypothetical protein